MRAGTIAERFAVLLRETSARDALQASERIRSTVQRRFTGWRDGRSVTASLGMADIGVGPEPDLLVAAADTALYEAKAEGRNRVVSASGGAPAGRRARGPVRPVD